MALAGSDIAALDVVGIVRAVPASRNSGLYGATKSSAFICINTDTAVCVIAAATAVGSEDWDCMEEGSGYGEEFHGLALRKRMSVGKGKITCV